MAEPVTIVGELERWPATRVRSYAHNPKDHPPEQLERLKASIRAYGFTTPLLVDAESGELIAGHARLSAALELGLADLPVIPIRHLSERERRAYRIADNRLAELARWNTRALRIELAVLQAAAQTELETGFSDDEIAKLLQRAATGWDAIIEPDVVVPIPERPASELGDLWHLGDHRLLCGDSTQPANLERLMGKDLAALLATDPPYCVGYQGGNAEGSKDWTAVTGWDKGELGPLLDRTFAAVLPRLKPAAMVYLWHAHLRHAEVAAALERAGLELVDAVAWIKPSATFGRSYFQWAHEPALVALRKGQRPGPVRDRATSAWEVDWEGRARVVGNEHPTQKPVRLFEIPAELHTEWNDIVLEPFCGSGSQIIAAERIGRRARALELEPRFVDVAVRRWQAATNREATLDGDGRTFTDVSRARRNT